jgi:hypothetical protein
LANPVNRILWWALLVSLCVYVVVAHVEKVPARSDVPVDVLAPILGFLSIAVGVGTAIYRRHALVDPIQAGELDPTTPRGALLAFQPFITNLVLSESVGIYGLLLSLLSGNPLFSIAFSTGACLLMFVHRPTAPDLVPPPGARRPDDATPIR